MKRGLDKNFAQVGLPLLAKAARNGAPAIELILRGLPHPRRALCDRVGFQVCHATSPTLRQNRAKGWGNPS